MKVYDVIVIGASQAGLAAAYYLREQKKDFVMLEAANRIGKSWADRYDSLKLFTSARYNDLPGHAFPGDKSHFPTKDEVANYLEVYASEFALPILLDHEVIKLSKPGGTFFAETHHGNFSAKNVIVCTGPFQIPFVPGFASNLSHSILQIHSSEYKNTTQLREGDTLVVGGGNSGVQIVEELVQTNRNVFFSFSGNLKSLPNNGFTQRLIFGSGITAASIYSIIGKWLSKRPEPVMGTNLKRLFKAPNLRIVGRAIEASGGNIRCEKSVLINIRNIIWATGFKPCFNWVDLDVFNQSGFPVHERGVTKIKGLFFLGLGWMYSRNSGLLGGIKADAEFITNKTI